MTKLKTKEATPILRKSLRRHAKDGDVLGMFCTVDSTRAMALLADNSVWFRERGLFERALLLAWSTQKFTLGWHEEMRYFLLTSNRKKLVAEGGTLPEGGRFTIYRGITETDMEIRGYRAGGAVRGISWTLDPKVARTFAASYGMPGKVYATEVERGEIFAHLGGSTNYRSESEVLVLLGEDHPVRVHESIEGKSEAAA